MIQYWYIGRHFFKATSDFKLCHQWYIKCLSWCRCRCHSTSGEVSCSVLLLLQGSALPVSCDLVYVDACSISMPWCGCRSSGLICWLALITSSISRSGSHTPACQVCLCVGIAGVCTCIRSQTEVKGDRVWRGSVHSLRWLDLVGCMASGSSNLSPISAWLQPVQYST